MVIFPLPVYSYEYVRTSFLENEGGGVETSRVLIVRVRYYAPLHHITLFLQKHVTSIINTRSSFHSAVLDRFDDYIVRLIYLTNQRTRGQT